MAALRRPFSLLFVLVAVVVGVQIATTAVASAAPAGDPATVAKVTNLNKKALEAYSQQDYDTARDLLKQALEICTSAGLDQHPITARTHVHFGVVAIVGFKQREVGLKQFRKALEIEPDIKLTKSLVTPELQDAFEEAVLAGNAQGRGRGGRRRRRSGERRGRRRLAATRTRAAPPRLPVTRATKTIPSPSRSRARRSRTTTTTTRTRTTGRGAEGDDLPGPHHRVERRHRQRRRAHEPGSTSFRPPASRSGSWDRSSPRSATS